MAQPNSEKVLKNSKLSLFLEHQYQSVSSFLLTVAILTFNLLGLRMPYGDTDFH